jgi:hypothetical protein
MLTGGVGIGLGLGRVEQPERGQHHHRDFVGIVGLVLNMR